MNSLTSIGSLEGTAVLSSIGQKFAASPDVAKVLALTSDGVLFVSQAHRMQHDVLAYIDKLEHREFPFTERACSLEDIKKIYQAAEATLNGRSLNRSDRPKRQSDYHLRVMQMIREAAKLGASDIHLILEKDRMLIRYRIHGLLESPPEIGELLHDDGLSMQTAIYGSMCEAADTTFRPEYSQDARLKEEHVKQAGLFAARVATRPMLYGPLMVMRLLHDDNSSGLVNMDDLGYLPEQLSLMIPMAHQTSGIVLLSGITGSGKSVTLKTMLEEQQKFFENKINVITIENPPEYRIKGVRQTPLICTSDDPEDIAKAWGSAITNLMRLDIDAAMVGEIRDLGSAVGAFRLALTGHGLFSTMHTKDATSNIQRLLDLGVEPSLVFDPSIVRGFINQALTAVLCDNCKLPYLSNIDNVTSDLQERISKTCIVENVFIKGPGCVHCRYKGFVARTVCAEVIRPTLPFMRIFRDKGKAEARAYWVSKMNGITKVAHAIHGINSGRLDPRAVEADVEQLDTDIIELGQ